LTQIHPQEDAMSKDQIRIELTPEQKAQVRKATGKSAEAVELSVEELEERIAPQTLYVKPHG
jgi:hypothetical protein